MGLLDDAIREHLDLKRRRGGDPADLERAEREALGPVRREPLDAGGDEFEPPGGGATSDQEEQFYDGERHEDESHEERDWGDAFDEEPDLHSPGAAGNDEADYTTRVIGRDRLEEQFAEPAASQEGAAAPTYSVGAMGDETVEYHIDDAVAAEEGESGPGLTEEGDADRRVTRPERDAPGEQGVPGSEPRPAPEEGELEPQTGPEKEHGDDVLEETPDFLQDTPDHDRLWFEQRPPRDFDFDG